MREVDADLYEFLSNHETGLYKKQQEIIAYVFIPFDDLSDFTKIVGAGSFDEYGGVDCKLQYDNVCIDINEFIEAMGHLLSSYKYCFHIDDYCKYEKEILEMEK